MGQTSVGYEEIAADAGNVAYAVESRTVGTGELMKDEPTSYIHIPHGSNLVTDSLGGTHYRRSTAFAEGVVVFRISSTLDKDVVASFEAYDPGDTDWNSITDPGFGTVAAAFASLGTYATLAALNADVGVGINPVENDIYLAGGVPYIFDANSDFVVYDVTPTVEDFTLTDLEYNNNAAAARRANRIRVKLDAAADPTYGAATVTWSYRR